MRKWREMRRLAGKEGSGRGLMKREKGSKGRKCANEKMAGNEDIGGKRGDGRGMMKRETGSKRRKCANEKMAGKGEIGGKRGEWAVCLRR